MSSRLWAAWLAVAGISGSSAVSGPWPAAGQWDPQTAGEILDKTLTLSLDPDLAHLVPAERQAVDKLLEAGALFQRLYERQRHAQAEQALADLVARRSGSDTSQQVKDLLTLYRLFSGPIATTLENRRLAFLPVEPERPGKNVYPADVTRDELDAFLAAQPGSSGEGQDLLHVRSRVRRIRPADLARDLDTLEAHPALHVLHPGLRQRLQTLKSASTDHGAGFYAVPYSVAYAAEVAALYRLLWQAADLVDEVDPDFSAYLRQRARDLLVDDYEAGDAAWVSGRFGNLNAQIGSYETYDDELYGVKSFFSLSLLAQDRERSAKLARAMAGLQTVENRLPYDRPKKVREDIPVGVYHVIADFGQARGTNSATILPNEADHARKYGRTILMRYNILAHPQLFALSQERFQAALEPQFHADLTLEGGFERVLWHEIGHYLGVDRTADGRSLEVALEQYSDLYEEMKSDLVSLFAARYLRESGYHTDQSLRSVYAGGVLRVLQVVQPRRGQPYQTMQLMQWNYFLSQGLMRYDKTSGRLAIDYGRYHEVVTSLLREVLAVQSAGDAKRAAAFVERWGFWRADLHEVIAERLRKALRYRFRLVRYSAIDASGASEGR